MIVLVVTHGNIKAVVTLAAVIRTMIKLDVDTLQHCFREEIQCTLAVSFELPTLSALDLTRVHYLPYAPLPDKDTHSLPEGNQ